MKNVQIPDLPKQEIDELLVLAANSTRKRHAKILHNPGDVLNRTVNIMMQDSYMQPHLHPSEEKIENIHLIQGTIAVLFFDDTGTVEGLTLMEEGRVQDIAVPAFTWHTYVILSESALTYETMIGKYEPKTWKEFAGWAPVENSTGSVSYLSELKSEVPHGPGNS